MRLDFFIAFWVVAVAAMAQQNVGFREGSVVSPQINEDNSVTFRLRADAAGHVTVIGDWAANGGRGEMTRNADGVWTYTTPVLPSEMYTYRIDVDGVVNLDPLNPFTRRDVGNVYSVFYIGGGCGDYYQVHDVPHGDVVTTWYHSDSAGADRRLSVYLPPCYGKEGRKYPVLYLLHGSGGDETAWLDLGHVARIMDNLIARGEAEPMIVVMPNGNFSKQAAPGETPENLAFRPVMTNMLTDYKNGAYEMAFTEIIGFIDNKYSTIPDRQHRAIAGLSMGGRGALSYILKYPDLFNAGGVFSYVPTDSSTWDWKGDNPKQRMGMSYLRFRNRVKNAGGKEEYLKEYDTYRQFFDMGKKKTLPKLLFTCGDQDSLYYKEFCIFKAECEKEKLDVRFMEEKGYAHEWRFWDDSLKAAFEFFKEC